LGQVDQKELMRLEIRERALKSLYYFGKAILGFEDFTPELHLPVADFIQDPGVLKKGLLMPRGHFKTSLATIAYSIWLYLHDHNRRILIANEVATNAQGFLRMIKSVFEKNIYFQWLFPEAIPDFSNQRTLKKWSDEKILLPRTRDYPECTMDTIGVGGAVTSRHYTDIILDDLVGMEASQSVTQMEKTIEWHKYTESLLENSKRDRVTLIGTRWGFHDLYWHLQENDLEYEWMIKECYENDKPIFPQRFDREVLDKILYKQGPYIFSCQYLNFPSDPELADFKIEWLQYYRKCEDGKSLILGNGEKVYIDNLYKVMKIDPAVDKKKRSARSAIIVSGVSRSGQIVILESWAKRVDPKELVEKIFEFYLMYPDMVRVGCEHFAMQKVLIHWINEEERRQGIWLPWRELKLDTIHSKEARIRSLVPYFGSKRIHIHESMTDFLTEYSQFPTGKFNDLLDALAYGPQLWIQPDSDEDRGIYARQEQETLSAMHPVTGY